MVFLSAFTTKTAVLVVRVPDGPVLTVSFLDYTLTPVAGDALSRLFAIIFAIMAFAGGLFALNHCRVTEITAAFVYAGSAIGVAFAGDMVTLFLFWEFMALGSTTVLLTAGGRQAAPAAMRYLTMHIMGGSLLLVGIIAWRYGWQPEGEASITEMEYDAANERLMFLLDPELPVRPDQDYDQGPDRWKKQEKH